MVLTKSFGLLDERGRLKKWFLGKWDEHAGNLSPVDSEQHSQWID